MGADAKNIIVQCDRDNVTINGISIVFPINMETLVKILGEPSFQIYDNGWNVRWDEYGVYVEYFSSDNILDLRFLIRKEPDLKHLPQNIFTGNLYVNGQNITELDNNVFVLERLQLIKMRYGKEEDVYAYVLMKNYNFKEETSGYSTSVPVKNAIDFKDFNFKLLVIEELMFNKELLKPKFDVYEFATLYDKRKIDIEEEGYNIIPEVISYFESLKIDIEFAGTITELYQDGGNSIYGQLYPFWDGEDNTFEIESFEDINYFANLKKMTLFNSDPKVYDELKSKGIHAERL